MSESSSARPDRVLGYNELDRPITLGFIQNLHRAGYSVTASYFLELYCSGFTYDPISGTVVSKNNNELLEEQ